MAVLKESSGFSTAGEFQTTKSTDIPAIIDSVELIGGDIKVINGNFQNFGAIGPGQSSRSPSLSRHRRPKAVFPRVWVGINAGKTSVTRYR